MDVYAQLATKVRKLRNERQWSQEELAERTNLHRTYISHIEGGKRQISIETFCKIAKGFKMLPSELMKDINL